MTEPKVYRNAILARLPRQEMHLLAQHMENVILAQQFMIATPGRTIDYVYFLEKGLGLIVAVSANGRRTQVAMFGAETVAPAPAAARSNSSLYEAVMCTAGSGYRIASRQLWELLSFCPVLNDLLLSAILNFASQASFAALSNVVDSVEQRLARWLLMAHDRLGADELELTHGYLAKVLGVRRPTITTSFHGLEGRGFIKSQRGQIVIRDRAAMAKFAMRTYGQVEQEYRQLSNAAGPSHAPALPALSAISNP